MAEGEKVGPSLLAAGSNSSLTSLSLCCCCPCSRATKAALMTRSRNGRQSDGLDSCDRSGPSQRLQQIVASIAEDNPTIMGLKSTFCYLFKSLAKMPTNSIITVGNSITMTPSTPVP